MRFYSDVINEHKGDQKVQLSTTNKMLHRNTKTCIRPAALTKKNSDGLADFFIGKITKIFSELIINTVSDPNLHTVGPMKMFSELTPVTEQQLAKLICTTASKSCSLDPAVVFKCL